MSNTRQVRVFLPPECLRLAGFVETLTASDVRNALNEWDGTIHYPRTLSDWPVKNLRLGLDREGIYQILQQNQIEKIAEMKSMPAITVVLANAVFQLFKKKSSEAPVK